MGFDKVCLNRFYIPSQCLYRASTLLMGAWKLEFPLVGLAELIKHGTIYITQAF